MLARLASAALLSFALCGVASAQSKSADPNATPPKFQKQFPFGFQWTAISINGKGIADNRPTLQVDDQLRARGFAGCNTYSATSFPLQQQRFAVGPLAVTRKACDNSVMALEKAFLVALRTAAHWDIKDGALVIEGPNGQIKFDRAL
jgi:heat shock protein HslJ